MIGVTKCFSKLRDMSVTEIVLVAAVVLACVSWLVEFWQFVGSIN